MGSEMCIRDRHWLRYELPKRYLRHSATRGRSQFKGQKQVWFMLRALEDDVSPNFSLADKPEFDDWRWVNYWYASEDIVSFKRDVYSSAMRELESCLPPVDMKNHDDKTG